jgi:hypothetical protein
MEKSKLIELIRTFTKPEMRRFGAFLSSPYYNTNPELVAFWEYLDKLFPRLPENKLKKELVAKKLYANEADGLKKLAYVMNYVLKLAEQFLAYQRFEEQSELLECQKLNELVKRNLEKNYTHQFRQLSERIDNMEKKGPDYFYYRYQLSDIAAEHFASKSVRTYDENLQMASDALDDFYFLSKLKYSCEMLNRQEILSVAYELKFMKQVEDYLISSSSTEPLIEIYLQIYFSLYHSSEDSYLQQLLKLIKTHGEHIEKEELRRIYLYSINLCLRKMRQGKSEYLPITLDLYEEAIQNGSLIENNYLSHWNYNNMVKLALRLKRFEWIENFIHTYSELLRPQFKEDAVQYNLAELFYHKKDYNQALFHLNNVHFTDINYHLGSRIVLIKTFYESGAEEALFSVLASFSVYLRRNKHISVTLKKSCLNFCNLLHQVLKVNQKKYDQLEEKVQTLQPLAERPWLLAVLNEQQK